MPPKCDLMALEHDLLRTTSRIDSMTELQLGADLQHELEVFILINMRRTTRSLDSLIDVLELEEYLKNKDNHE